MTFAHIFDLGAACALAFFVIRGVTRGLTGEVVSLLGLVASFASSWTFSRPLAGVILRRFPDWDRALLRGIYGDGADYYTGQGWDRTILELVCAVALFMAVSLAFAALARILRSWVRAARLSFLDHTLGAFTGALRVFLALLLIYGAVTLFSVIPGGWMRESVAMRGAAAAWPPVFKALTERGWLRADRLAPEAAGARDLDSLLNALPPGSLSLDSLSLDSLPSLLSPDLGSPGAPQGGGRPVL
jgi:uncharacterized membrane protein required for colicin V production